MSELADWTTRPTPGLQSLNGRRIRLEPLDWARHAATLFSAVGGPANEALWRWMPSGPFMTPGSLGDMLASSAARQGWRTLVMRADPSADVLGMASYMRIREDHGSAEIGCVVLGSRLQRTREATEALALMARHVFDLGYRRYEWKCHQANLASQRAAERFGFTREGVFRNDMVVKGGSRDTVWYSVIDREWPAINAALTDWLSDENFTADGRQKRTLASLRR